MKTKKGLIITISILAIILLASLISAQIPRKLSVEGRLLDSNNNPKTGTFTFDFKIYDVDTGGAALYTETQSLTTSIGLFDTVIGDLVALNLPFDKPYFLEIVVDSEILTPRRPITSAAYVLNAENATTNLRVTQDLEVNRNASIVGNLTVLQNLTIGSSSLVISGASNRISSSSGDIQIAPFSHLDLIMGDLKIAGVARISAAGAGTFTTITGTTLTDGTASLSAGALTGLTTPLTVGQGGTGSSTASGARANLFLVIGTDVQAFDSDLTTYAGITPSANIQTLLGSADFAAARTNLGLAIGTDVQAFDAELAALAGLASAADKLPYFTGSGTAAVADLTSFARTILDDANAGAARTTLGAAASGANSDITSLSGLTTALSVAQGGTGTTTSTGTGSVVLSASPTFTGTVGAAAITATGDLIVDTNTLFVDSTNNKVGIGDATPTEELTVAGDAVIGGSTSETETLSNAGFSLGGDDLFVAGSAGVEGTIYTDSGLTVGASTIYGDGSIKPSADSATALQIQNAAGTNILNVDTTNSRVGIGTSSPSAALHITPTAVVSATGGTITTDGSYTVHTFTSSGTFTPDKAMDVEYLVVAGGGGGGGHTVGGGGGAGAFRTGTLAVTAQAYPITVGAGGTAGGAAGEAGAGGDSIFSTITSSGGGRGAGITGGNNGGAGGSGGGGRNAGTGGAGGTGGNNGGGSASSGIFGSGGGGGASAVGATGTTTAGGNGGAGTASSISGSSVTYAGGGGGGISGSGTVGTGGAGGGGNAGASGGGAGTDGTANTGGGGGGSSSPPDFTYDGGAGGSGIVIIRYKSPAAIFDGNVGIGTTTPTGALDVAGPLVFDSYTKLLLHTDGTDGSTTFTDEIGKTVTASNGAQIDTAQSKFGGASGLFDGTNDYVTIGSYPTPISDFAFGNEDFTIDFWLRLNAIAGSGFQYLFDFRTNGIDGQLGALYFKEDTAQLQYQFVSLVDITQSDTLSAGTWYHIALVRSSGTTTMYVDGVSKGAISDTTNYVAAPLVIGAYSANNNFNLDGWIDEFRVSKGIARWTNTFTPPTSAYSLDTAISNLIVTSSGKVGIGTSSPDTTLEVLGGLCVSDASGDNCATTAGTINADGAITANAFDLAERIWSSETLEAGDVVVIDTSSREKVKKSTKAYDITVAGIVSTKPGNILGWEDKGNTLLSLAGRVPVKVTSENGQIEIGDLLTTSSTPGHAMKCTDVNRCSGAIVGKAFEPMKEDRGKIITLVTLQ